MQATIEISYYPLGNQQYEQEVIAFIEKLRDYPNVTVETNGMSTQLFGEYHTLMHILTGEIGEILHQKQAIYVLKIGKGELRYPS
ncbi:hypothetical protein C7N43_08575 [Sphingobacteriales bacterium UPWRP_1]|nr:hypothetical protein B6N25_09430 [Sphingobacteriales bacterium TSM_CSS]PSJ77501.1 hypothetical protein C7N43_08575 [Sphingobacteriales bacterium UPWRP_1]